MNKRIDELRAQMFAALMQSRPQELFYGHLSDPELFDYPAYLKRTIDLWVKTADQVAHALYAKEMSK